nr:NAD(P)-dependent oxidoreductase [Marinicella sp. W31]MDC2880149.1 NAD(P)-dependent oxidoreductase [Marinicella sp. W31]
MRRILMTGAGGVIGREIARRVPREGEIWRLSGRKEIEPTEGLTVEYMYGDLVDYDFALELCEGVDAIIHMAGNPKEGPWGNLLASNVVGAANLWEAAAQKGVDRVLYGSSNHVLGMYPTTVKLDGSEPLRPDSRYGVTKAFGEALASLYADKYNVKGFVIRIGSFQEKPRSRRELSTWVSARDLAALVRLGLDADYHHEAVFGISANSRSWCDNGRAFALGYRPQDDAEDYVDLLGPLERDTENPVDMLQGGGSAGKEFRGDLAALSKRDAKG